MRRRTLNTMLGLGLVAPFAGLLPLTQAQAQTQAQTGAGGVDIDKALATRILGDPEAPVRITEYFSLTCPHCARFHGEVLPELKKAYIDTGKLQIEMQDYPLDQWALRAAAMARALEGKRYFAMIDILMKRLDSWARSNDPYGGLVKLGRLAGLSTAKIEAHMTSEALIDHILNERLTASRDLGVNATPSFVMNGRKLDGVFTFESFEEVIADA